jgi:PD-(D/E)XK endonuclease
MEEFIVKNIESINEKISDFKNSNPNAEEIKNYLSTKFMNELPEKKDILLREFEQEEFVRARVKNIANKYVYYKGDLERFYNIYLYHYFLSKIDIEKLFKVLEQTIQEQIGNDKAFKFIRNDLKKISKKFLYLILQGGFQSNIQGLNHGVMIANSGDSAQFLFLSRAILAGFNCSNVDVRSSRYDAIIDYENSLLRVQVKGVSSNTISFKDRDRGGQGIDHTHERNRGRIITSKDCDIYVAVDKQCGICYIIPMYEIDNWNDEDKIRVNIDDLDRYCENWDIIRQVVEYKNNSEEK